MTDFDDPGPDEPWEPAPVPNSRREPAAPEGVRIIGAEEARAAIEGGHVQRRLPESEPRFGDVPDRPTPPAGRTVRLPLPGELIDDEIIDDEIIIEQSPDPEPEFSAELPDGPPLHVVDDGEPFAEAEPVVRIVPPPVIEDQPTGVIELPHWTEPPTGEVPRIRPEPATNEFEFGYDDGGDDLEAWASLTGSQPRFRDDASDWSDEDYTHTGEVRETVAPAASVPVTAEVEDDDAAFEREVQERRRTTRRRPPTRGDGGSGRGPGPIVADEPPSAPPSGRNLPVAVATGVGVGVVAIVCMLLGAPWVLGLAAIIIGMAALEFYDGLRRSEFQPATLLGVLGAVTLLVAVYHRGATAYPLISMLVVVFSMFWYLAEVVRARPVSNVGATLLGFGYVGILGSFAGLILAMPWSVSDTDLGKNDGVGIILGLALCVVGSDVVAYFVGSRFGRTKLSPSISPNKTVEGLAAGAIASILIAVIVVMRFSPWDSFASALALGVVVAVMAPIGDLVESMLKRDLGVKDFGSLLPGHGGVLDRFDSILICLPAVYYLALALFG